MFSLREAQIRAQPVIQLANQPDNLPSNLQNSHQANHLDVPHRNHQYHQLFLQHVSHLDSLLYNQAESLLGSLPVSHHVNPLFSHQVTLPRNQQVNRAVNRQSIHLCNPLLSRPLYHLFNLPHIQLANHQLNHHNNQL